MLKQGWKAVFQCVAREVRAVLNTDITEDEPGFEIGDDWSIQTMPANDFEPWDEQSNKHLISIRIVTVLWRRTRSPRRRSRPDIM